MTQRADIRFAVTYILLAAAQIIICNYMFLGPLVTLTLLPPLIMFLPLSQKTSTSMLIAFLTGLVVDWISDGVLGLNAAALIPVALLQKPLIRLFVGEDVVVRGDAVTVGRSGWFKVLAPGAVALGLFLAIYIILDGAGTKTFLFNLGRWSCSFAACLPLEVILVYLFSHQDRREAL